MYQARLYATAILNDKRMVDEVGCSPDFTLSLINQLPEHHALLHFKIRWWWRGSAGGRRGWRDLWELIHEFFMSMKKRQTDGGMVLDSILLSPRRRYVCYQERHFITAWSGNFTPFTASLLNLEAVCLSYYKTSFSFYGIQCYLLDLLWSWLILSCLDLKRFYSRLRRASVYYIKATTRGME